MRMSPPLVSDQAVKYILTRKMEDLGNLTEASIAKAIGVNTSYLLQRFEKDQKITLKDFIVREKIHTAIFILEEHKEESIDELAVKLGFLKKTLFIDAFTNYIGIDPLNYKKLKHNQDSFLDSDW